MAVKHLFTDIIEDGEELARHPEATHLRFGSGRVRQYFNNPNSSYKMVRFPTTTNSFEFRNYEVHGVQHHYGTIIFYDMLGNALKTYETYT